MRKELDEALCTKYPEIFKDRHGNVLSTAMCWGFECDDGWYKLIDTLCEELMKTSHLGIPIATQVKEKYGRLCFYVNGANELQWDIIDKYEGYSEHLCEVCGKNGKLRGRGWYKTLCDKHTKELKYEDFEKCPY